MMSASQAIRKFSRPTPDSTAGFSLVEVMVAGFVMALLTVNLLALVAYAGMFRARAKQASIATTWIQQDLENVRLKASAFQITTLTADAAVAATSITVDRVRIGDIALRAGDTLKIGTDSVLHTVVAVGDNTLTFTPGLNVAQHADRHDQNQIWVSGSATLCNASASAVGLAEALKADLEPIVMPEQTISGRSYQLRRSVMASPAAPYQALLIDYAVVPIGGGSPILSSHAEVIPNAAFGCP